MKKMSLYGAAVSILICGIFLVSCGPSDFFIGGKCEVDPDCNSWSQQAEGTICVSGQCVCADPDKYVGCAPGEDGCRPACIPKECSDLCLALPPTEWSAPVLVWTGSPDVDPGCPEGAPLESYRGFANPSGDALACPACECEGAATACLIPTQWTASTTPCNIPGGSTLPFGGPLGWDGSCTSANAIAGGVMSYAVPAPTVTTAGACVSTVGALPDRPPATWGSAVLACEPAAYGRCDTGFCVTPPPDTAWQACVLREGDRTCPDGYPKRSVYYKEVDDTRGCAPCSCSAQSGGECTVSVSVWQNGTCSGAPLASNTVTSPIDGCYSVPVNMGMGSKAAQILNVTPVTCAPAGGAPTGSVMPSGPTTICCGG